MGQACCRSEKAKNQQLAEEEEASFVQGRSARGATPIKKSKQEVQLAKEFESYLENSELVKKGRESAIDPDTKMVKFEVFLEIYRTLLLWNKIMFMPRKIQLKKERREYLRCQDETAYQHNVMQA